MSYFISCLDGLTVGAAKLGVLPATAVWAFFSLILMLYVVWLQHMQRVGAEEAWTVRLEESRADALMAQAIGQLSNEIKELRHAQENKNA